MKNYKIYYLLDRFFKLLFFKEFVILFKIEIFSVIVLYKVEIFK